MDKKRRLNIDVAHSVADLQAVLGKFELRSKLYRVLLKARGLEFDSFKEYNSNDDSGGIDWKASMRANKLLVRKYKEETNLKIMFIIDVGENMVFGSAPKLKCEYAAEVAASLAHLIINSGDQVGYILFSNEIKRFMKPVGGNKRMALFADDISDVGYYSGPSNLNAALDYALAYIDRGVSSVIMISDFVHLNKDVEQKLSLLGRKFETLAIKVNDPLDSSLPNVEGELIIEDPQTGQQLIVNPQVAKEAYEQFNAHQEQRFIEDCRKSNIDLLQLNTFEPFIPTLARFLKLRLKKRPQR